jgi:hypothetical protein
MNINEMISDSLKYPFSDLKKLLGLGILMATSILIIPAILSSGYVYRIIQYSFNGSNELPPFNKWFDMFTDGLKFLIVSIVYIGVPAIITSIIATAITMSLLFGGQMNDFHTFLNSFFLTLFIMAIIIMAFPYVLSFIAFPHIVKEDKVEACVKFKDILSIIKKIGRVTYLAGIVLLTVFAVLINVLEVIPRILGMGQIAIYAVSAVVGFFIGSYVAAFRGRFLAMLYQEGIEEL